MENELLQATSIMALLDTTKEERLSFVMSLMDAIDEGTADILKVHKQVKCFAEIENILTNRDINKNRHADIANKYHSLLQDAAALHGKNFQLYNAEFKQMEAGVRYDFKNCYDAVWQDITDKIEFLKSNLKKREDFLKSLPVSGAEYIDKETGELTKIYPPLKKSTTTISCSLR